MRLWARQYPDWRDTRAKIYQTYYRKSRPKELASIVDALPNGLMGVMALIYGDGDFKKTLSIAATAGLDSDNQPATLGGLLGVIAGADALPEDFLMVFTTEGDTPFYDTYINHTRDGLPASTGISELVIRIADVAEAAILANGGEKRIVDGRLTYILNDEHRGPITRD